jgi:hypothetical protein
MSKKLLTYKGVTKSVVAWSIEKGIPYQTLLCRVERNVTQEIIFEPFIRTDDDCYSASAYEAWRDLSQSQIETMREFDQLGRIAQC